MFACNSALGLFFVACEAGLVWGQINNLSQHL